MNIFRSATYGHSDIVESFIAGVLAKTPEITLFLNPLCNFYERFGSFEAPKYVSWSNQNRSQLVRIPAAIGKRMRMELRSPDPSANPYLAYALIMAAGLEGVERKLELSRCIHPFYIGVQFHPEFLSRPNKPHPLFLGLFRTALKENG